MKDSNFLDTIPKVFVLNLPERTDRYSEIKSHLDSYHIKNYNVWYSAKNKNGAAGLKYTLRQVFSTCLREKYSHVLILEDDAQILVSEGQFHETINAAIKELPKGWLQLYLGVQLLVPPGKKYSDHTIQLLMGYSTHAIIYSKEGIEACLERWKPFTEEPVDMFMSKEIMPLGKSFCTIPMLVTQRPSKSDIDGRFYDWGPMLHGKFEKYTKHLK